MSETGRIVRFGGTAVKDPVLGVSYRALEPTFTPRQTALMVSRALAVLARPCNHPSHDCEHGDGCSHHAAMDVLNEFRYPRILVEAST